LNITFYNNAKQLPDNWNDVIGINNIFLSTNYFSVLDNSKPKNMECFYVGFFQKDVLIGGAIIQKLNFETHTTFQNENVKCSIKNFITKKYCKDILILGNNMLTGQNGFYFNLKQITQRQAVILLEQCLIKLQREISKTSLIIYKDYQNSVIKYFKEKIHSSYFKFSVQPNMILKIRKNWLVYDDYINDFSTKYRTRAKTARKKCLDVEKRELDLGFIKNNSKILHQLYNNVADNATFNTFFLAENHFESLKYFLKDNFKIYGYFIHNKLVGFYTIIINNKDIDTYFLGYDKETQKEYQLYLNMLLDMVDFAITHNFKRIIFGRTALEIKSTIGAEPLESYGLIKHNMALINKFMYKIFPSIEPKIEWIQRKPFK